MREKMQTAITTADCRKTQLPMILQIGLTKISTHDLPKRLKIARHNDEQTYDDRSDKTKKLQLPMILQFGLTIFFTKNLPKRLKIARLNDEHVGIQKVR
jgi:hypothetical protein